MITRVIGLSDRSRSVALSGDSIRLHSAVHSELFFRRKTLLLLFHLSLSKKPFRDISIRKMNNCDNDNAIVPYPIYDITSIEIRVIGIDKKCSLEASRRGNKFGKLPPHLLEIKQSYIILLPSFYFKIMARRSSNYPYP